MGVIGRRDPAGQNSPEIDLSGIPDEGVISRTHARVYWDTTQNTYMVVDTSRNGTYLNAKQLTPGTPYRLGHGDELQLGQNKLVCLRVLLM
jgi:pSer/pThr/pTyr-binding forkhead associated (FHA) protein